MRVPGRLLLLGIPSEVLGLVGAFLDASSLLSLRLWCRRANESVFLAIPSLVDRFTLKLQFGAAGVICDARPTRNVDLIPRFVRNVRLVGLASASVSDAVSVLQ